MENFKVFAENAGQYDDWYNHNYDRYVAELAAIRELMPDCNEKLEIGVGSGRFAAPLGIEHGLDPAEEMLALARKRGIKTVKGVAENLPYDDNSFDYVLMTTTVCFLDDINAAFAEVLRVLKPSGTFSIAFVDKNSSLGQDYKKRIDSKFYAAAKFYSPDEIIVLLNNAGFEVTIVNQTLLCKDECHFDLKSGYGQGAFVIVNSQLAGNV